jgi:hypothetical protein
LVGGVKREEQTTTEQLKSMHMQINKQKCILKLSLFNLFDMHLMHDTNYSGQENKRFLIIGKLKFVLKYSSNAYQIN